MQKNVFVRIENERKRIDDIDEKILHLLAKRSTVVRKIGILKFNNQIAAVQPKRIKQLIISRRNKASELGLDSQFVEKLYQLIHQQSVKIQKSINKHEKK